MNIYKNIEYIIPNNFNPLNQIIKFSREIIEEFTDLDLLFNFQI